MKVQAINFTYSEMGLELVPETDVEAALLSNLWARGSLQKNRSYCIMVKPSAETKGEIKE